MKKPTSRECQRFNRDVAALRKVFLEQPQQRAQLLKRLAGFAKEYAPKQARRTIKTYEPYLPPYMDLGDGGPPVIVPCG